MNYTISQLHRDNFKPTFLYIKQHTETGKLYFGKTTKKNVERYTGSGIHWGRHTTAHGKDKVVTLWYCLFTDIETLVGTAVTMSEIMDITGSDDWLNFKPENGLDGGSFKGFNGWAGKRHSPEHIEKLKKFGAERPATEKMRSNMARIGKLRRTQKQIAAFKVNAKKIGAANAQPVTLNGIKYPSKLEACKKLHIGHEILLRRLAGLPDKKPRKIRVPFTNKQKAAMRATRKPRENITCSHCGKISDPGNYSKHHGDKCKHVSQLPKK